MNDTELITVVRDSFTGVRATTPPDQIARRGRAVRARRRNPALAGVALAAGAAAAAFAVSTSAPATHPPAQPGNVQLAAWTVAKQPDGSVRVTIRELMDPAGLQAKLRAAGVPASVTTIGAQNASCRPYPASWAVKAKVFSSTISPLFPPSQQPLATTPAPTFTPIIVLLIHPAALPAGTGVQIAARFAPVASHGAENIQTGTLQRPSLVYASPACTGS